MKPSDGNIRLTVEYRLPALPPSIQYRPLSGENPCLQHPVCEPAEAFDQSTQLGSAHLNPLCTRDCPQFWAVLLSAIGAKVCKHTYTGCSRRSLQRLDPGQCPLDSMQSYWIRSVFLMDSMHSACLDPVEGKGRSRYTGQH